MSITQTIILSLIEGLTEFLPVSSTGHLILTSNLLKIAQTDFLKTFEIVIQFGAILAVLYLYLPTVFKDFSLWPKIIVAFIPTAILGFVFYSLVKNLLLGNTFITLQALFFGGLFLIGLEFTHQEKEHHLDQLKNIDYKQSFLIGLFQSISMIPGVSRSAASIVGGLLVGLKRSAAIEFSFLLAIPTMFAAASLDLYQSHLLLDSSQIFTLLLGLIVSFITAIISIKFLLNFVKKHSFIPFGIYRIILSLAYYLIIIR